MEVRRPDRPAQFWPLPGPSRRMSRTLNLRLDPHLLSALPHFFSGPGAALRELFQNSHRAGATHLELHFDPATCHLRLRDNGVGCPDPQILLTAAQSGWGPQVIDPAGLGVFSLLDPHLTRAITFQSHDWAMTLTPDLLSAPHPVTVTPISPISGFQVDWHLAAEVLTPELIAHERAFLPLYVTLDGRELPPPQLRGGRPEIPLACGQLVLHHDPNYRDIAVWEGFPIPTGAMRVALARHLHREPLAFALLAPVYLAFAPSPQSEIRPTLPDRTTLREDAAFEEAMQALAQVFLDQQAQIIAYAQAPELPDLCTAERLIAHLHASPVPLPEHLYDDALRAAGWSPTLQSAGSDITLRVEEEGGHAQVRLLVHRAYLRAGGRHSTPSRQVALNALRQAFPSLPYGWDAAQGGPLAVQLGAETPPEWAEVNVALGKAVVPMELVREIVVEGVRVPFFLGTDGRVLLQGPPECAEVTLDIYRHQIGGALLVAAAEESTLTTPDEVVGLHGGIQGDFLDIRAQQHGEALRQAFILAAFPERQMAFERRAQLNAVVTVLQQALYRLCAVQERDADVVLPEQLERLQARIDKHLREMQGLTRQYRLP